LAATRLQLQDADTGALILIDIVAEPAAPDEAPLEPIRIIHGTVTDRADVHSQGGADHSRVAPADTPIPVVLTRYAAQSLYAPLRTVEPVAGVAAVPLRPRLTVDTLLPSLPVQGRALGAWRLGEYWVTAIKLIHTASGWLELDPRLLQGDFSAATFQHRALGPAGDATDTTVLYLVTRGHGLTESLLPAIAPADPAIHLAAPQAQGSRHEK
jgi:integrating conjugative element protein (TIGR03749 family)